LKVTRKVTLPPESDCGAGSTALASVLDTCTAPEKLETTLFEASSACTDTLSALPDRTEADAGDTEKCVADTGGGGPPEPESPDALDRASPLEPPPHPALTARQRHSNNSEMTEVGLFIRPPTRTERVGAVCISNAVIPEAVDRDVE
jgi:hypothetical protein